MAHRIRDSRWSPHRSYRGRDALAAKLMKTQQLWIEWEPWGSGRDDLTQRRRRCLVQTPPPSSAHRIRKIGIQGCLRSAARTHASSCHSRWYPRMDTTKQSASQLQPSWNTGHLPNTSVRRANPFLSDRWNFCCLLSRAAIRTSGHLRRQHPHSLLGAPTGTSRREQPLHR